MPEKFTKAEIKALSEKYGKKVREQVGESGWDETEVSTIEFKEFKKELLPKHITLYEKACNFCGSIFAIKPKPEKEEQMRKNLEVCHLDTTPSGVLAFSFIIPIIVLFFGVAVSLLLLDSLFFAMFFMIVGASLIIPLGKIPKYLADNWRMKASNQMVLCIFYVVTYMRQNSNLELAIQFASMHLSPPLSLDLRKVLWDVETEKYPNVKESLDNWLETWREYNMEFVEGFHLIESSLYEASEERRLNLLDKSLDVILNETYEKMIHYAQNLKSPITMLHMIGVIMPILGLVILPLVVSFMTSEDLGPIRLASYIAVLYDVGIPVAVYYLGKTILSKRPGGYGDTDISEENPELKKYKNLILRLGPLELKINPFFIAFMVFIVFFLIGISPLIMHILGFQEVAIGRNFELLGYRPPQGNPDLPEIGPFGLGASLLSVFVVLALGYSPGLYYKLKTKHIIKLREKAKQLEQEFASALFQLGNRLGDGIPAELAFSRVADVMKNTISGDFFLMVDSNIRRLGMSVKDAIFDPKHGALAYFPSKLIESSMKVLVQSIRKGPLVAASALVNISRYIREIHRVDERLKDLMEDVISSMKSQIKFLTPAISGIVVGITSMITFILGKLVSQMTSITQAGGTAAAGIGAAGGLSEMFGDGVPTFYFQIVVGIYVLQIIYIITILVNGIENGEDKLNEKFLLGKNLIMGSILYCSISLLVMLLFNLIAGTILASTLGG